MYTCATFISTPSLVRRTSTLLSRSLCAVEVRRPETLTDESHSSLAVVPRPLTTSLTPSRSFQTSAISRDIDTAAKFIGLFSYPILCFALSEAMGLFCLMVAFLILFAM
ncbi:hypothetical protein FD755_018856 [Muntiacus reevesi]|uniref:ATPase subunit c n=1 Tax=Muntiacus reevesi TaxID=9886 RepID=A0A5N3X6Y0_MUNRE|nr:hypothetical protein FD755_018856 [Muntiacus reevesi]